MGMTFQAFRGSSGAQIAFTILLATSIGDRVTQCTAHERGVANAVKVGQSVQWRLTAVLSIFQTLLVFICNNLPLSSVALKTSVEGACILGLGYCHGVWLVTVVNVCVVTEMLLI